LPNSANLTIRQLGLLLCLATTKLASGQAFASPTFSLDGLKILLFGAGADRGGPRHGHHLQVIVGL